MLRSQLPRRPAEFHRELPVRRGNDAVEIGHLAWSQRSHRESDPDPRAAVIAGSVQSILKLLRAKLRPRWQLPPPMVQLLPPNGPGVSSSG